MPLSKAKQAKYQRDRRERLKLGMTPVPVIPNIEGLRIEGNRILGITKAPVIPKSETLPIYNPAIHRPGDKVLIQRGKQLMPYLVPDLDAGGQSIPDYW